ncbi:phage head spike fiber domain-containing protein [Flavobacterium beibuense]|uniref:phage head spike fiber domain-containing protein n=1 Tax=Flavobacterium beibuense TaxID=657326 RepID=UPI003A95B981
MIINNGIKYNPVYEDTSKGLNYFPDNMVPYISSGTTLIDFDWGGLPYTKAYSIAEGSTNSSHLFSTPALAGQKVFSFYIKMDDGSEPVVQGDGGTIDFSITITSSSNVIPTGKINVGNNVWRIYIVWSGGSEGSQTSVRRASGMSTKGYKICGMQLNPGTVPDPATPTYGTAVTAKPLKPFTVIRGNTIYGKKRFLYDTGMIFAKATEKNFTMPDLREKLLINDFIKNEIRSGKWHEQDLYAHFAYNAPELVDFARINWHNPFGKGTIENICTHNTDFSNPVWGVSGTTTKTPNGGVAPDGSNTACLITYTDGVGNAVRGGMTANGTTMTYSIYVKAVSGTGNRPFLIRNLTTSTNLSVGLFNLSDSSLSGTGWTSTAEGNGWYRISVVQSTGINIGDNLSIYLGASSGGNVAGEWLIWHPQLENNSYATDFIPTGTTPEKGDNLFLLYGGLTYGAYGFLPNGIDAYIDTQFNPATMGKKYTLNNAGRGAVVFNDGSGSIASRFIDGNNRNIYANKLFAFNTNTHRINQSDTNLNVTVDLSGNGYKDIMRTTNVDVTVRNKAVETAATSNSTIIENYNQLLFKAQAQYSNVGLSAYSISAAITFAQSQAHRGNINNLLAGFGLNQIA